MNSFDYLQLKVVHLEVTTACNAVCPQCQRTIFADKMVPYELTLADIKLFFSESFVRQLNKVFMCGNFGDPAAAKDTLKILKWFKAVNPNITLGINTNGGIRSKKWWAELATIFSDPRDYVIFSIDGLADTNHIYRVNVKWNKLIENATAYIQGGGSAHWDMLVYAHNEHQVDEAIAMAKNLGFSWFRSKVTRRKLNNITLQLPQKYKVSTPIISNTVRCHVFNEESVYVSATGHALPCCFIGSNVLDSNFEQELGITLPEMSLRDQSFADILPKFNILTTNWSHSECVKSCSVQSGNTNFSNQWKNEIQLK
jgi:MoaA/NifB/PqqE/SkfB family radical SAM enzyme